MATWTQFTWFNLGNTGMNNTGINFTWFNLGSSNAAQRTNPLSSRYPWLSDEEIEELRKAANSAGYTGNNELKGMDIIFQDWIDEYERNKKLDEANSIINQNCEEIAKYSGSNKKIQEQISRIDKLWQRIKETNSTAKAWADNCKLVTKFVTSNWYQKQYENYLNWDDELLDLVEQDWTPTWAYTPWNKWFWQTKAGAVAWLLGIGVTGVWVPAGLIYGAVKWTKAILKKTGKADVLADIGKKWYSSAVTETDKDKRLAQRYNAEKEVLADYKKELDVAKNNLAKASEAWDSVAKEAAQKQVDELTTLIDKYQAKINKWFVDTSDTAMKYDIVWGSPKVLWAKAEKAQLKLWDRWIWKALQEATNNWYVTDVNELINRITDDIIENPLKYAKDPEAKWPLVEAAQKIKKSWQDVDYANTDPIHLNELKSKIAERNVSTYNTIAKWWQVNEVDNAATVVREEILKEMRAEIYAAWESVAKEWAEWADIKQLFKEWWDLDVIKEDMLKQKDLWLNKKWVTGWLERQFKTRVGKKLAQMWQTTETTKWATEAVKWAEAVTEATKWAEIAGEATKGAEVVSEATKWAEVASDVARGAEVASEVSKWAEVAGKTEAVTSKVSKAVETALKMEGWAKAGWEVVKVSKLAKLWTKIGKVLWPVLKFLWEIATPLTYYDYAKELSKTKEDAQVQSLSYLYKTISKRWFAGEDIDTYSKEFANLVNKQAKMFGTWEDLSPEEVKQVIEEALREKEWIEAVPEWVLNQQ